LPYFMEAIGIISHISIDPQRNSLGMAMLSLMSKDECLSLKHALSLSNEGLLTEVVQMLSILVMLNGQEYQRPPEPCNGKIRQNIRNASSRSEISVAEFSKMSEKLCAPSLSSRRDTVSFLHILSNTYIHR